MGKVLVTAKIDNLQDLLDVERGTLAPDEVRSVEVTDAVVDTGATMLSLPKRLIDQLGLIHFRTRRVRTVAGVLEIGIYGTVRLTIDGREFTTDVAELSDDYPVLVGQLPLEGLDLVVDPVNQKVVGNPEHGGEQMIEIF